MGRERRGNGKGEVSLRATWGQGGRDRTTQKEGFQLSKREWKGTDRETGKGSKKGELHHNLILSIYVHFYNDRVNATNNLMC
jgi:hypothetical protein